MSGSMTKMIALAALLAMPGSMAFAQQGNGPGNGGRFDAMDTDQNGMLTLAEVTAAAEDVFNAMDADTNDQLTKDEYMAVRMGKQDGNNAARQAERQAAKEARFLAMDSDKNGTISRQDFIGGMKAIFAEADSDGDGQVTRPDWRDARW